MMKSASECEAQQINAQRTLMYPERGRHFRKQGKRYVGGLGATQGFVRICET